MTGLYRTDTEALDECLRLMFPDLESDDFRTDGGNINMPKVRTLWRERQAASGVRVDAPSMGMRAAELTDRLKAAGYKPEPEGFLWVFSTDDLLDIVQNVLGASSVTACATVPLEPTQAMLDAADKVLDADPRFISAAWRAMVAAAGMKTVDGEQHE